MISFLIYTAFVFYLLASSVISTPYFSEEMPWNCRNKEYCDTKPPYYYEILRNSLATLDLPYTDNPIKIGHRTSTPEHSECESTNNFAKIYQIMDDTNTLRYVVQEEDRFMQYLRIEECSNKDTLLTDSKYLVLNDNNVTCVETRLDYTFLVLAKDGNGVATARTKSGIPVQCSCKMYC